MGKSAAKPAATSTAHDRNTTPKKRVDKVVTAKPVTAKPVTNGSKPSPKIDLKPSKPVQHTINAIDHQVAKENVANDVNMPSTKTQPADKQLQSAPTPLPVAPADADQKVTLEWTPHMGSKVFITGSFCDWNEQHPVTADDGSYKVTLDLPPGKHLYKFVVDGQWFYDITQPTETDAEGNVNNILTV